MSFWSDASPITKGVVILGPICILLSLLIWFEVGPFGSIGEIPGGATTQQGIPPQ